MRSDDGSGAAGTLILVGGVLALSSVFFSAAAVFIELDRAQSLTDTAALEAADAASGRIAGYPCDRVERLAKKNNYSLHSCTISHLISRVTLGVTVLGIEVEIRAKAGPQNLRR
ncbi:Rv3654c family TadE-like protein [Aurantimicrobium minutum]|uniref:Rv3654c family TadE-like protein n=1 Tax=Aurantimicrobium minutum TaxID=708131 RepID=UPI002475DCD4|nr:Rv3654c family TadE-like protein [Aurantimicrobium minutum]